MRITILDYGAGNLHSLLKAIPDGATVAIEADPVRALATDVLVLPGVGAFAEAAGRLAPGRAAIATALRGGLPTLGICLGAQMLFAKSEEGAGEGLAVIPGCVTRLDATRVPQIGWNRVEATDDPLFARAPLDWAYYANGFACRPTDAATVVAWSTHERDRFPAVMRAGHTIGVQFHPEKSSAAGVRFLRAAIEACRQ